MRLKRLEEENIYSKGAVYGRLTLTGKTYMQPMYGQLRRVVEADCDCGVTRMYSLHSLRNGDTKSCGCLQRDSTRERFTTHGLTNHPLFDVWQAMLKRCYVPHDPQFKDYGGRGIFVIEIWQEGIVPFYEWAVVNGYQSGLSLERRDNDKGYNPDNCYWATRKQQNRNTRRNINITAFGETKCLFDWADDSRCAVNKWGLRSRYREGKWTDMEAMISTPPQDKKITQRKSKAAVMITAFGETKCYTAWLEDPRCLVKLDSLRDRYKKGWDGERILTTPPSSSGFKGVTFLEQVKSRFTANL